MNNDHPIAPTLPCEGFVLFQKLALFKIHAPFYLKMIELGYGKIRELFGGFNARGNVRIDAGVKPERFGDF